MQFGVKEFDLDVDSMEMIYKTHMPLVFIRQKESYT